ncbi:MAG: ABC transporter ATP-binding protein [Planctomycetes bacterium]|nr:ABC transporter ATP-binding protein [Planctomycetota bacterium]
MVVPHSAAPILKVEHLSYRYPTGQLALRGVSLTVGLNEIVGLVGPNGAGKTTLLLHLNGLLTGTREPAHAPGLPANPAATGRQTTVGGHNVPIEVLGMPVTPANFPEIRRNVGVMFQDPDDQLFCPTVRDDVAFGPLNLEFPRNEVRRRVAEALTAVGLADYEERRPHELSFGEKRRVCLAGVLACEPSLLALDEPSSNLDPRSRRGLIEILKSCRAAQIIASHDLEMIVELCQRVIVLDHGQIQADGPTRDILGNASLMARHGLEVPLSIQYGLPLPPTASSPPSAT